MEVGGQHHAPAAFPRGMTTRYPLHRRLGGHQEKVWTGAENLTSTGIRFPDEIKEDKLINSVKGSSTRQTNSKSYGQIIPSLLCTPNFHLRIYHITPAPIPLERNPLYSHIFGYLNSQLSFRSPF